ncbi:unnamed protein product [Aphanomyces euteiches]|uniref:Uncharacterized protein n=1 Tax=Aphanomyces euteiches TaxID=100861 RepID=A0A6G0WIS4_9STRA|nr:hypothetical protein Ae201684_014840 [Aphanomyces euteiches]KAH9072709.1 hypothetical protein Ae201684P_015782 [Aphanomyces euteiches]
MSTTGDRCVFPECTQAGAAVATKLAIAVVSAKQAIGSIPASSIPGGLLSSLLGLGKWYEGLSRSRMCERFVTSFQMRVEDEYMFGGNLVGTYDEQSGGNACGPQFVKYYELAQSKGMFPQDWSKQDETSLMANAGKNIHFAVEKSDVTEKFGNTEPMLVRMIAEEILGPIGKWVDDEP